MKALTILAAVLTISVAPMHSFYSANAATLSSVGNFNGTLNNSALVVAEIQLPKCYPYCGG
jgi:hypothetical protein